MSEEEEYTGIPAKCFVCKDGGDVRVTLGDVETSIDGSEFKVDMTGRMRCLICGGDNVGFEYVTVNIERSEIK